MPFETINLDIADDGSNDWVERKNADGSTTEVVNGEHIQRSRVRIDARKWLLSKLAPKKYGDKLEFAGDPNNPIVHEIRRVIVDTKSDGAR